MPDEIAVPEGWTKTTLGAIGRYLNGRAFKTSEWSKTGRPIIRIQDLTGSNSNPNFYDGAAEDRHVVRTGDLLISWSATLGAYIWDGPEAVLNQHIFKVESKIDKRFHYHLVRERLAELDRNAHGSGMVHVTKGIFDATPVSIPIDEAAQRRIAGLIDAHESRQQSSLLHLASARRAIERSRQAILAAACSGRLTTDWRDANDDLEPAEVLIERSIAQLEDSGDRPSRYSPSATDFIDVPASWAWAPIGWIAAVKGGIQKQPKRVPKQNAYPYLRVANVHRGRLDLAVIHEFELFGDELETYRLEPGDLLIVEGNGSLTEIGRSALWRGEIDNCVHQNHIIRVRCVEVEPAYLDLFWNSPFGSREIQDLAVTSAGLYSLSTKKIASFSVPVPPLEEQREIVRLAGALLGLSDQLMDRVIAASRLAETSAQAVLAKAFRGDLIAATEAQR